MNNLTRGGIFSAFFSAVLMFALGVAAAPSSPVASQRSQAAVVVQGAWVRATVPGQPVAAAYMQLQAQKSGLTLTALRSPVAASVQLHDMQMQGEVMRMSEIKKLTLVVGQAVSLRPGGKHIMLIGIKQALAAGDSVPLELLFSNGRRLQLNIPVLNTAPTAGAEPAESDAMVHRY